MTELVEGAIGQLASGALILFSAIHKFTFFSIDNSDHFQQDLFAYVILKLFIAFE